MSPVVPPLIRGRIRPHNESRQFGGILAGFLIGIVVPPLALVLVVLGLGGCAVMTVVEGYVDDGRSTVYVCEGVNDYGHTNEWCYDGPVEDIEEATGLECHASRLFDRTSVIGCWYHCDDPTTPDINEGAPRGCNAHNSCWGCPR